MRSRFAGLNCAPIWHLNFGTRHLVGKTATHEIWMCFCRDPERNLIGIAEQTPIAQGS
jgi:hypothetical protein